VAALVLRFDFNLDGAGPKDLECVSDQFIIGTKTSSGICVFVSKRVNVDDTRHTMA
jgi:hypothetical protein